jgi:TonB-dependent receptor
VKRYFLVLVSLLFTAISFAQNIGVVGGRITDAGNNEPLAGVSIAWGNAGGSVSDVDGRYALKLSEGKYTLTFNFVGYSAKEVSDVVVKAGETTEFNIVLESASKELNAVTVTASVRKESIASVLSIQKNNISISDGISIESIRRSPDRNVGEVLKRVSGTSIQDDKFVVVRGLSDRYNIATLNGALLPSTEPDRRAFSFDIVPSALIDNIIINKTASPDMPGDFSGGIIQINTKDIPYSNFFSVSAGVGYNTQSTGKEFRIGILEPTDYLGFDNGTRLLPDRFPSTNRFRSYNSDPSPENRLAVSRMLRNNYGDRYNGNALPGFNFGLSWGAVKDRDNGSKIGSIIALTYRNSQNIQYNLRQDYQTENNADVTPENLFFQYNDTSYSFSTSIGVLANFGYKKGNTKIVFKNLLNQLFENTNLHRSGYNYDNIQYVQSTGSIAVAKSLISSQLEGEHKISSKNDRLKWNVNYGLTLRDQPDYRVLPYAKSIGDVENKDVPMRVVLRDTYRFWSDLTEHAVGGSLNYSLPVTIGGDKSTFKAGLFAQNKFRDFSTRIFRYEPASPSTSTDLYAYPADKIFNDGNMVRNGFVLNEITNNTDKYDATSGLYAGYAMIDARLAEKLRAVIGARVESFSFVVNTSDFSNAKVKVKRDYIDVLPSLNLTYNLTDKTNLRFSASRTVSRPEFREVANFAYFDFVRNAQLKGNVDLERSQNTNVDLRFETYPTAGEIISASLFYKHFDKPIEQVVLNGSTPSNLILSYTNPNSAQNFGVEMEIRKKLGFISESSFFENLLFYLNAAYIKSEVEFNETSNPHDPDRPLQGQSPYLINTGLQYSSPSNKFNASVLYNRVGHRISAVGFQGYPDIYENARDIVDVQLGLKVLQDKGEVKFNVSDLLNQRAIFYQNVSTGDNKSYSAGSDRTQYSFRYGSNLSIGFSYNF